MQAQIDRLEAKFANEMFIHDGIDLINDVDGRNYTKWASRCSVVLFTKEELTANVLIKTSKSSRGYLDPVKVCLLKSKFKVF